MRKLIRHCFLTNAFACCRGHAFLYSRYEKTISGSINLPRFDAPRPVFNHYSSFFFREIVLDWTSWRKNIYAWVASSYSLRTVIKTKSVPLNDPHGRGLKRHILIPITFWCGVESFLSEFAWLWLVRIRPETRNLLRGRGCNTIFTGLCARNTKYRLLHS